MTYFWLCCSHLNTAMYPRGKFWCNLCVCGHFPWKFRCDGGRTGSLCAYISNELEGLIRQLSCLPFEIAHQVTDISWTQ